MKKDFLSMDDLSQQDILDIFALAGVLKSKRKTYGDVLGHKTIGLIFEKPSNRTRV